MEFIAHSLGGIENFMKYILVIGDGMADHPVEELGGRTPLQTAHMPTVQMKKEC